MAIPVRAIQYQWESLLYRKDVSRSYSYNQEFGPCVLTRDKDDNAEKVQFTVYVNDPNKDVYLVGEFNDWGKDKDEFKLNKFDTGFQTITTTSVKHKDAYLFLVNDNGHEFLLRDPASVCFDKKGNSQFWDFDDPSTFKKKYEGPNTLHRATKILQTDLPGLVAQWFEWDENAATIANTKEDLFTYIRTCGVLEKVHELGFNTIQFLPIAQSIDGDNWKFRYLSPYPFAVQRNWGTPDSFLALIDECHRLGIAIITDIILSHSPHKQYTLFGMRGEDVGIHRWQSKHKEDTYLEEFTPWGTKRFRYGDEHVRRYLVESALHVLTRYGVDGFRIDNVDGILRYGDAGQGDERPHGRLFLRELIAEIYKHNPLALIHLESHYFYGDNAKMLVAPLDSDNRALGATAYNSSRLTYYFHKEIMPKTAEEISVWRFEQIREEKEWGKSNSTIADFHNHDAAAGLMAERATGSYAYDALILKRHNLWFHAIGKIKIMESIIAFGCEGRILDLLQTFLLQEGTFEHDSSIHWGMLKNDERSQKIVQFKKEINNVLNHPAFWSENTLYRKYLNVDEQNKVLVIKREDKTTNSNEEFYILINLSSKETFDYAFGIEEVGEYELVFNSDEKAFMGTGKAQLPKELKATKTQRFALFKEEILIPSIAPYHVLVFKHKK
ncbi:alpha amylase C-terminal domain-containing protein [Candidatus Woesearchaeota archaeon]|nr:alpha amylase C-terminal domain-containing protein [Candidatus Woesearchaeota archaeon]